MFRISIPAVIIFLTAVFLFLAATNIQGGWLYMVDAFLWSLLVVSAVLPLLQLRRLHISRQHPASVYAGQDLYVQVEIKNPGRFPVLFLSIRDTEAHKLCGIQVAVPVNTHQEFIFILKGGESWQFEYPVAPLPRGVYQFSQVEITSFGPFGLIGIRWKPKVSSILIVKPARPVKLPEKVRLESFGGDTSHFTRKKSNTSLLISHFRDYHPGDNKRSIHWKNSARLNKLTVYEMKEEYLEQAVVIFDTSRRQSRLHFEKRVQTAGSLIATLVHQHFELTLLAQPAQDLAWMEALGQHPQRSSAQFSGWLEISQWLACLEPDANQALAAWLSHVLPAAKQRLLLVTDQLSPDLKNWLEKHCQATGSQAIVYYTEGAPAPAREGVKLIRIEAG